MNKWAKDGRYDCHFLCICILGDASALSLAKEMSSGMQLTHCVNGFIDNDQDMPTYGQLGCKGFIVLDENHGVVNASTSVFMQVKDLAFGHVEALLDAVCAKQPLPKVCPGEYMVLDTPPPEAPELKGCQGICVKVDGPNVHFGFMSGPMRGRAMALPAWMVSKLGAAGGGASGASGACADGNCGGGSSGEGKCGTNAGSATPGSCAPGAGCDGSGACLDAKFVDSCLDLMSVKVPSMDDEHADCAAALRALVEQQKRPSLEAALRCLAEHFEHEEALFEEFGFGAHANANLSAAKSHAEEHRRILDKVRGWLGEDAGQQVVPPQVVRELLQDFHEHTIRYDSQYAEPLSAKGAK
mmetsp:Transcript_15117/g.41573  ORF Transcript_15117/g.41573 Transcript_15117/m.41573 type:complete len:355 (-) Transcript_15117:37-1101(-)